MPYSTKEQVADEFQGITFSASTDPTGDTVDRWITEADALIDSKVGLKYVTPITDSADLIVIRMISIMLVSGRVRRRLKRVGPDQETQSKPQDFSSTDKMAMSMLNDIVAGKTALPNSSLKSTAAGMTSFAVQSNDDCPHTFKKNVDQW